MKKSTIKRRKRVVPANQEPPPDQSPHAPYPTSVSPEPSHIEPNQYHPDTSPHLHSETAINLGFRPREIPSEDRHLFDPTPVDFTGYQATHPTPAASSLPLPTTYDSYPRQPDPYLHPPMIIPSHTQLFPPIHTRKRSFSVTEESSTSEVPSNTSRPNRLSSISALLNPAQPVPITESSHIDPHLQRTGISSSEYQVQQRQPIDPNLQRSNPYSPPPSMEHHIRTQITPHQQLDRQMQQRQEDPGGGTVQEKVDRKAQLRREAQEMRERLMATEMELERLDGEE